jgi:hypothetical protein
VVKVACKLIALREMLDHEEENVFIVSIGPLHATALDYRAKLLHLHNHGGAKSVKSCAQSCRVLLATEWM